MTNQSRTEFSGDEGMSEWKDIAFRDVLREPVRNGIYKQKEFHGRGTKIVNMGELFAYPRLQNVDMKLVELTMAEKEKCLLKEGDLIFARRSLTAEGAGKCSVVMKLSEDVTFESSIIRARPDREKSVPEFLYYYFNSPYGKYLLRTILRQVTVSGITGSDLMELVLKIPNVQEQKAIAQILSSLDDKIDLLHRQNKTLEAIAETLFRQWFIEEAQDDWEEVNIGQLGRILTGKTPSTQNQDFWGEAIDFITPTDFRKYGKYTEIADRGLSLEGKEIMKNFLIPANSILVTCIGSDMGKIAISRKECITNQQINSLVIHSKSIYLEYVYQYLKNLYPLLRSMALGGTTMPIINKTDFSNIEIPLPPDKKLEKFNLIVSSFNEKNQYNLTQIHTLKKLRDTLLPKLMSGEVQVKLLTEE